jgi:hypothetical protein
MWQDRPLARSLASQGKISQQSPASFLSCKEIKPNDVNALQESQEVMMDITIDGSQTSKSDQDYVSHKQQSTSL